MAKLDRERRVRMRRHAKQLKKDARRLGTDILGETDIDGEPLDGSLAEGADIDGDGYRDAQGRTQADREAAGESEAGAPAAVAAEPQQAPDGAASPVG